VILYTKQHLKTGDDENYEINLQFAKDMLRNQYMHEFKITEKIATYRVEKDLKKIENILNQTMGR